MFTEEFFVENNSEEKNHVALIRRSWKYYQAFVNKCPLFILN